MKRIGIIVQDIASGIGNQTREFARFMKPDKVLITDLTASHEAAGKTVKRYPSWYEDFETRVTSGMPTLEDADWLLTGVDVLYFVETVINWDILGMAEERGIKVIGQMNYELIDKLDPMHSHYPAPSEIWLPSTWCLEELEDKAQTWNCQIKHVPVPVNREKIPFRPRKLARTFLHVAGHDTYETRNGTDLLLAAIPLVKNQDIKFIIRTQHELPETEDSRVFITSKEVREYWDIYNSDFDVLLLPRKYGGLSLQRDEALSSGAPVIMLDVPPQTGQLPEQWLVPAHYVKTIHTRPDIDVYECTPEDLAAKIDYVAALSELAFSHWSLKADDLIRDLDWKRQEPVFRALLNGEEAPEPKIPKDELLWT